MPALNPTSRVCSAKGEGGEIVNFTALVAMEELDFNKRLARRMDFNKRSAIETVATETRPPPLR